jgi:hypothetical protein
MLRTPARIGDLNGKSPRLIAGRQRRGLSITDSLTGAGRLDYIKAFLVLTMQTGHYFIYKKFAFAGSQPRLAALDSIKAPTSTISEVTFG